MDLVVAKNDRNTILLKVMLMHTKHQLQKGTIKTVASKKMQLKNSATKTNPRKGNEFVQNKILKIK